MLILLFTGVFIPFAKSLDSLIIKNKLIDTTSIKIYTPTTEQEKEAYSELTYDIKIEKQQVSLNIIERFLEWLSDLIFGKHDYSNVSTAREIIIWAVVIIGLIIIIIILTKTNLIGLVKAKGKNTAFNFSDITEDLEKINFEQRISDAIQIKDYRLAIRWHYLKILYLLDKHKFIVFAPYKTNFDYAYEISKENSKHQFKTTSKIYEFVWYGEFEIDENKYATSKKEFIEFEKTIHV